LRLSDSGLTGRSLSFLALHIRGRSDALALSWSRRALTFLVVGSLALRRRLLTLRSLALHQTLLILRSLALHRGLLIGWIFTLRWTLLTLRSLALHQRLLIGWIFTLRWTLLTLALHQTLRILIAATSIRRIGTFVISRIWLPLSILQTSSSIHRFIGFLRQPEIKVISKHSLIRSIRHRADSVHPKKPGQWKPDHTHDDSPSIS
jgi:hypothetical protein